MTQYVYRFGGGVSDGGRGDRNLLGGKGANLDEMASIGLPVPPGFTISTAFCAVYYDEGRAFPQSLRDEVVTGIAHIEGITGKVFGDAADPLLVSVRSGARASMPGMMDTVLNLGLNDATVQGLAAVSGDDRFAWDSYRRFIQMYSDVVLELDHARFEEALEIAKEDNGYYLDTDLTAADWQALVTEYKALVQELWGRPFPQDVHEQLWGAVGAVFGSWQSERAKVYRRLNDIPSEWGTAVNVQAMVFGNMGDTSATGVAFTRDPAKGDNAYYGEFLINAQGEDVVAGIRTPQYLTKAAREAAGAKPASMEEAMPEVYGELANVFDLLERHYRDMQDIEFTVQQGKLWMLQTRAGKRTAKAALKIAVDMASEGLITREEAIARIDPAALDQLLHPTLDPNAKRDVLTKGLPASPGAASGRIVFTADAAERAAKDGQDVILVRVETSPEDIHGMHAAKGILTARGGMTSHAAVVARGMGRPCVSGAGSLSIGKGAMRIGDRELSEGDTITIDGTTGEVMAGQVPTVQPELSGDFGTLMEWADGIRRMKVRCNAETPLDCRTAREFGAEGIGLCRTEHMFMAEDRQPKMRRMIMSDTREARKDALAELLPLQQEDFEGLFEAMKGLPVTIRLLDPPLHEFLPDLPDLAAQVERARIECADDLDELETLLATTERVSEENPMLGTRGCRLGILYPEIYEMQVHAIMLAAKAMDEPPHPEIMIPLVDYEQEIEIMRELVVRIGELEGLHEGDDYTVGTMIELPRACFVADRIAKFADFFSFGTNDLTQTALGFSRDDVESKFVPVYMERKIIERSPFETIDKPGVGWLVRLAAWVGREAKPDLKLGICGEHGGDPDSIEFFHMAGLDYVSCSPFRVPIARVAAAQAAIIHADDRSWADA